MGTLTAIRYRAEPQRSLAFGSIGATYMGIGASLSRPIIQYFVQNGTDAWLQFSFDGVNDHFPLPPNGFFLSDVSSNQSGRAQGLLLAEGERFYVKQIGTPTTGNVYVSTFYGGS